MSAANHIEQLLNAANDAFLNGELLRLKLTGYTGEEPELKSIEITKIIIKSGEKFSFTYHYKTRDIIKNFAQPEAMALLRDALTDDFRNAQLKTTNLDFDFQRNGSKTRLKRTEISDRAAPSTDHNRAKNRPLTDTNRLWLKALGIAGKDGTVRHKSQDKFRQINKMVEIFAPLIQAIKAKQPLIVDMGAGKGYLDFALYDYLTTIAERPVTIVGVEMRQQLVNDGNANALASGFEGLEFQFGTIMEFDTSGADAVIALHACDTATDDAIFKGISAKAALIAVAPCCHKQIRQQMTEGRSQHRPDDKPGNDPDARLDVMLRHGIFMERQAEMVTDTLRALMMELHGYRVNVFEFVSDAHTPKNILIVAQKDGRAGREPKAIRKQITDIKTMFAIKRHHLETLLDM